MKMRIELQIIMLVAAFALPIHAAKDEHVAVFPQLGQAGCPSLIGPITSAAFSPNGQYLLVGSVDGSVKLLDVASGREIRTMIIATSVVWRVSWSSDGKHALFLGSNNIVDYELHELHRYLNTISIWDVFGEQEVLHITPACSRLFRFATYDPLSKYVLYADVYSEQLSTLHLYDIARSADQWCSVQTTGVIESAVFTPDGNKILSISAESVMLWNAVDGSRLWARESKCDLNATIAIAPNERYCVNSDSQGFRLWDMTNASHVLPFKHYSSSSCVLSFSPDSQYLLFGGDRSSAMWNVSTRRLVWSEKGVNKFSFNTITFDIITAVSPDWQHYVAKTRSGELKLMNMATHEQILSFGTNTKEPKLIKQSREEDLLLVRYDDGDIGAWDTLAGVLQSRYVFPTDRMLDSYVEVVIEMYGFDLLAFSTSGRYLTASSGFCTRTGEKLGDEDSRLQLKTWDMVTDKQIWSSPLLTNCIPVCAISRDAQYAVVEGFDKSLCGVLSVWDTRSGQPLYTNIRIHTDGIPVDISTNANYSLLFEGGLDGSRQHPMLINLRNGLPTGNFSSVEARTKTFMHPVEYEQQWHTTFKNKSSTSLAYLVSPEGSYGFAGEEKKLNEINDLMGGVLVKMDGGADIRGPLAFSKDQRLVVSRRGKDRLELGERESGQSVTTFATRVNVLSSVALTADGLRCITAGKDGATRVFSTETGQELASMYLFRDNEWITITPEGYYNSSPNGDKYLNVRIGNRVYGVDNFRKTFYKPRRVQWALAGGSLARYQRMDKISEAPIVTLADVPSIVSNNEVTLTAKFDDIGGGVGDVHVYLNGSSVVMTNESSRGGALERRYTIRLVNGINTIRVAAYNQDNTMESAPAEQEITAHFTTSTKPALHAVVVGINDYKNPSLKLEFAAADAQLFVDSLRSGASRLYDRLDIRMLTTPEETSRENIIKQLQALRAVQPQDLFVLFVAAHGKFDEDSDEYFLLTSNVGSTEPAKLREAGITQDGLTELIANIPTTKKLVLLDTCDAQAAADGVMLKLLQQEHKGRARTRGLSEEAAMSKLSSATGSAILSATTQTQGALEGYKGHGLFSYVVAEGLNGKADTDHDWYVKTTELADYVDNEVPALAEQELNLEQCPTFSSRGAAFPVVKVK